MNLFKILALLAVMFFFSMPAVAQQQPDVAPPAEPDLETAIEMDEEQDTENVVKSYERPVREGPATATDKIVDRFMELNINPEESAGVDFEEFFTMVMQRAMDRFETMDANQDDEVTAEEYRAFWKAQKSQYYRLKR